MRQRFLSLIGMLMLAIVSVMVVEGISEASITASVEQDAQKEYIYEASVDDDTEDQESIKSNARVIRVVDGDTMVAAIDGIGEATIRFLGVNTPETVDPRKEVECFGQEASHFTKELLEGKRVLVLADVLADERDRYGRLLRNVYLSDGTDVNAMLIEEGYAYAYVSFPQDPFRKQELKQLEAEAKRAGRGLWGDTACAK